MSIHWAINKLFVLGVVTTLVAGTWTALSLSDAPLTAVDLDRGSRLFERRCATCHVLDASRTSSYGPNLSEIGALAASRVPSQSAEEYLLQSIVNPNAYRRPGEYGVMPADVSGGLAPVELVSLVGFLMQHGGSIHWPRLVELTKHAKAVDVEPAERIRLQEVEAGKDVYVAKAKCQECHPLRATPGATLRAPSLLKVGQHSTEYLRESIQHPSKTIVAGYSNWSVWLANGQVVTGRLLRSTDASVELLAEQNGTTQLVRIRREDIQHDDDDRELLQEMPHSMMPENLTSRLTAQEFEHLLDFLKTLK